MRPSTSGRSKREAFVKAIKSIEEGGDQEVGVQNSKPSPAPKKQQEPNKQSQSKKTTPQAANKSNNEGRSKRDAFWKAIKSLEEVGKEEQKTYFEPRLSSSAMAITPRTFVRCAPGDDGKRQRRIMPLLSNVTIEDDEGYESHSRVAAWPMECTKCTTTINNLKYFGRHMKEHWSSDKSCPICGAYFLSAYSNFATHLHTHLEEKNYVCKTCKKIFRQRKDAIKHQKHHQQDHQQDKE